MKAISLLQPWATLMAEGHKTIETRSWQTRHRGPLLIHASAKQTGIQKELAGKFFNGLLGEKEPRILPAGAIIGMVTLVDVFTTEDALKHLTNCGATNEVRFGDYGPHRFAWLSKHPVLFKTPIPATGALSLWTVPENLGMQIAEAIAAATPPGWPKDWQRIQTAMANLTGRLF